MALDKFAGVWDEKYTRTKSARAGAHTGKISTPSSVTHRISAKAIYTTNAIESLNSVIRQAIKSAKVFLNGRLGAKSDLSGDTVGVKNGYANPELAA